MNEEEQLKAFRAAVAGDDARLRDLIDVRWKMRSLAVHGQSYRVEAFLTVPSPASHTLIIDGGLDVGKHGSDWRPLQRHPGEGPGQSESRLLIRDLPVFVGDVIWDGPKDGTEAKTPVAARLRLRFELIGADGGESVELVYTHQLEVRSLTTWPDDYPAAVRPTWTEVPIRFSGHLDADGGAWVNVDLLRPLELGLAWEVQIQTPDGSPIKHVDWAVPAGLVQGISTPVPVPSGTKSIGIVLRPSRRVARSEAGLESYADVEVRREVSLAR